MRRVVSSPSLLCLLRLMLDGLLGEERALFRGARCLAQRATDLLESLDLVNKMM